MPGLGPSMCFFDDYFVGAGDGSAGADNFALDTPATIFRLDNSDDILNQYQRPARAHVDTQFTAVTLFLVYHGHYNHYYPLHVAYSRLQANYLYVTFVSKRCLHHFLESFFISNHNAVTVKPEHSFFFEGFERPADYLPSRAGHSGHFLLREPRSESRLISSVLQ